MSNCGTLRVLSLPLTSPHMDKENPGSKDSIANSLVAFICSILLYEVEWKDGEAGAFCLYPNPFTWLFFDGNWPASDCVLLWLSLCIEHVL